MLLNLRAASILRNDIKTKSNELVNTLSLTKEVSLSQTDNIFTIRDKERKKFLTNIDKYFILSDIHSNIRQQIGQVNAESGINDLLNKLAFLKDRVLFLRKFNNYSSLTDEEISKNVNFILGKADKGNYYDDDVKISIIENETAEYYNNMRVVLEREIRKVNEEILSLNIRYTIDLSEEISNFLTDENLI